MSYCRFENTAKAMQDCVYALEERDVEDLSSYEVNGLRDLLSYSENIVDMTEEIKEIINNNKNEY